MATLNLQDYNRTEDALYTDGSVEQEMYRRAKEGFCAPRPDDEWAIRYHFSPLRHNILCWFPFKEHCSILEIGGGCGAVTGLLCDKADKVTVCELTLPRARINYERHKDRDNLEIHVCDFSRFSPEEKYDYVIINGVLEYIGSTAAQGGEDPYAAFLGRAACFLADGGKILLAIENRFGLKYFAGAPEDHLGTSFSGIQGYGADAPARTFDYTELSTVIRKAGLHCINRFYPYPDYKFPEEIFTEKTINSQFPAIPDYPVYVEQALLFSEQLVRKSLMEQGIAQYFSNSFLWELATDENTVPEDAGEYIKLSTNRAGRFALFTALHESAGIAVKQALTAEGEAHLRDDICRSWSLGFLRGVPYDHENGRFSTPLLKGESLSDILAAALSANDTSAFLAPLDRLKDLLYCGEQSARDGGTAFAEVFGQGRADIPLHWLDEPNADLVFDNLFPHDDLWHVIDCEWVFSFPVPAEFILWRAFRNSNEEFSRFLSNLFGSVEAYLDIPEAAVALFEGWENHFGFQYVGWNDDKQLYPAKVNYNELINIWKERPSLLEENHRIAGELSAMQVHAAQMEASFLREEELRLFTQEENRILLHAAEENERHIHGLAETVDSLRTAQDLLRDELELKKCRLQESERQIADAAARERLLIQEYEQRLAATQEGLTGAQKEASDLRIYAAHVQNLYQGVITSQTWRLTAPLRWFLDKIRKISFVEGLHHFFHVAKTEGLPAALSSREADKALPASAGGSPGTVAFVPAEPAPCLNFAGFIESVKAMGGTVYDEELLRSYDSCFEGRFVVLAGHVFDLTGAPVALLNYAVCVKDSGDHPVLIAPRDGALLGDIHAAGIPAIVLPELYADSLLKHFRSLFDFAVVNTIVGWPLIRQLGDTDLPVFWWIHEARVSYSDEVLEGLPRILPGNIHVLTVGTWADRNLKEFAPEYAAGNLFYPMSVNTPEEAELSPTVGLPENKKVFLCIGTLEHRKGQDILLDAISMLSADVLEQTCFVFVGMEHYAPIVERIRSACLETPESVLYFPPMQRDDLFGLYRRSHALICCSRDDPLPCTITEALAFSLPVICSENTGYAPILLEDGCGLVYRNNDASALADCITKASLHPEEMTELAGRGLGVYQKYFTEKVFRDNLRNLYNEYLPPVPFPYNTDSILRHIRLCCRNGRSVLCGEEFFAGRTGTACNTVMIITHELSLTGAPIALLNLAENWRKAGANILVVSPFDGPMRDEWLAHSFSVFIHPSLYADSFLATSADYFDAVVLSTVVAYQAVPALAGHKARVLWWIHDSRMSYTEYGFDRCMPAVLPENTKVLCGGEYAKEQVDTFYPSYHAGVLYYSVKDCADEIDTLPVFDMNRFHGKKVFLTAGTLEYRKGQSVLVDAIRKLPKHILRRCAFLFIGKEIDAPEHDAVVELCRDYPDNVFLFDPISHDSLLSVYSQCHCLICCSRDDPLPVVVTEMQMLSRPVICSSNTGSYHLIEDKSLCYENDDPDELCGCIIKALKLKPRQWRATGAVGRKVYEQYFSEEAFAKRCDELYKEFCGIEEKALRTTVSVIIPTYNAGAQFEDLLTMLKKQQRIGNVEIVIVDSGSTDGTAEMAAKYGAMVKKIPQSEFTHSGARNSGASLAIGEILLFMTQDALPSSEQWIFKIVSPILSHEAVAVSPREVCPEGTDLHYRVASSNHVSFLGIDKHDSLNRMESDLSAAELRFRASLNDVSCAIPASLFSKFRYRYNYAEDLDLGIRLLKAGYAIKLLNEPHVIHGHNRDFDYYFRRSYVDDNALRQICRDDSYAPISIIEAADFSIGSFQRLLGVIGKIRSEDIHDKAGISALFDCSDLVPGSLSELQDSYSKTVLMKLSSYCNAHTQDTRLFEYISNYCQKLLDFSEYSGMRVIDDTAPLCDSMIKESLSQIAVQLSRVNENDSFVFELKANMKGI